MKLFIVICRDRHCDDGITAHATRESADVEIEKFKSGYADMEWTEEDYGRSSGWVRYVSSVGGDGPNARIQEVELKPVKATATMDDALRNRLAKLLWQQVARQRNPWFDAAASRLEGYRGRWETWNIDHIDLLRALCAVVFGEQQASDELLKRAVDFLASVS